VKGYDGLTKRGQARRLRRLALNALAQYDLEVTGVELVGLYTNALFRVRTADRASYVLRVCRPGWRTATDLQSEAQWLQALHRDTDIGGPQPIPLRNGEFLVTASAPGVPEPRRCLLMSWLPGRLLGARLTEANLAKMGALMARLQQHGAAFHPGDGFTRRRMNAIYARGEEDVLSRDLTSGELPARACDILQAARTRVDAAYARLYSDPAGLQVIHNDLHHDNIKLYRGRLHPFDFEDTVWGYRVQDVATGLLDLAFAVPPERYGVLAAAYREGYERLAPWPETYEGEIEALRAGLLLWRANWVARYERQYLGMHVEWTARILEGYLGSCQIALHR